MTVTITSSENDCGALMRYCICGKAILRRSEKGHREREYCSDACRQRACRARNRPNHDLDRMQQKASERYWTELHQEVHRETWQDELENNKKLIKGFIDELQYQRAVNEMLLVDIELLNNQIADKEAEIARLMVLLENAATKRKR